MYLFGPLSKNSLLATSHNGTEVRPKRQKYVSKNGGFLGLIRVVLQELSEHEQAKQGDRGHDQ
jgi:hypothetical protein